MLTTTMVRYELANGVAQITLADAERGNALNAPLLRALVQALRSATMDPHCRVILLKAEGPDFCQGLDLGQIDVRPDLALGRVFLECLTLIADAPCPVVACVAGKVTGGGLGLVAACDLVLADRAAVFMLSEVIVGMIPALIAPFLLGRLPVARVRYLALSSRGIPAAEAQIFGLVDEVAPDLAEAVHRQVQRLLSSSPEAMATSKRYLTRLTGTREEQTDLAMAELQHWLSAPARVEAIQNFAQGLTPPWFQKYRKQRHD
ncbi:enoyl-CoA hydratase/isomerase family protein [Anthocerotibacter panamensis]|uniref:enoyl-CoA hydratase/isomerase family protein n=1 Tax=Anthocerotibacter panamensis TaxID=2857077 RepID=UPI001C401740|nr:enoyl-CoA hydratase/isomerase family protein [Anthocerotibacter panamensis]